MNRTEVPAEFRNTGPTATAPQLNYLRALRSGKDLSPLSDEQRDWLMKADFDTFPSKLPLLRMGEVIEQLKKLDWKPKTSTSPNEVPDGRYAIPGPDGALRFYSVKAGHSTIFVDVWASDTRYPVKNQYQKQNILKAIAADPDSGPRFGREIGRCYVCGRTLTDELSRSLGIGPICREL